MKSRLQIFPYILQFGADLTEEGEHTGGPGDLVLFGEHLPVGAFEGEAAVLHEEVDLAESLKVVGSVHPVALGVAHGFEELRERVGPETHEGDILAEGIGHFTY